MRTEPAIFTGATASRAVGLRRRGRRSGSAVVEMAIVLPVLLMLSLGAGQYGYFFYLKNTLQAAAQAGARAAVPAAATNAAVVGSNGVVTNMLTAAGIPASKYTVTLNPSDVSNLSAGTQITVTVSATWGTIGVQSLGTGLGGIGAGKTITGVAVTQKEGS